MKQRPPFIDPRVNEGTFALSDRPLLPGARVYITGAGTGIGRGAALEFARER